MLRAVNAPITIQLDAVEVQLSGFPQVVSPFIACPGTGTKIILVIADEVRPREGAAESVFKLQSWP